MEPQEVKSWLAQQGYVRFKEKNTNTLFDVMLYGYTESGEPVVLAKQSASVPAQMVLYSITKFCQEFEEYLGPQV